jgi:AsmA protein
VILLLLVPVAWHLVRAEGEPKLRVFIEELLGESLGARGIAFAFDGVTLEMMPLPRLVLMQVHVSGAGLEFTADSVKLRPRWRALLRGVVTPSHVFLDRPALTGRIAEGTSLPVPVQNDKNPAEAAEAAEALPEEWRAIGIVVTEGSIDVGWDGGAVEAHGINCDMSLDGLSEFSGSFAVERGAWKRPDSADVVLEGLIATGQWNPGIVEPAGYTGIDINAKVWTAPWLDHLNASIHLEPEDGGAGWHVGGALIGDFVKDGVPIPFALSGTARRPSPTAPVSLDAVSLRLGTDEGRLDGQLSLGDEKSPGPRLDGSLALRKVSLTRWLGFARNLSPGLQRALDEITDAHFSFAIDGEGLSVPRIAARASGSLLTGNGGVPSWKKPEVVLHLAAPHVVLGVPIPEAVGVLPEDMTFPHGPLTPLPGAPLLPGEIGVDYDINLAADTLDYGPLKIAKGKVAIRPGKMDANGYEDTLIIADGHLYGGTMHAEAVLGGTQAHTYAITAQMRDVDAAHLSRHLRVMPATAGQFSAEVDIQSRSRKLAEFLADLRGSVKVRGEKGRFKVPKNLGSDLAQMAAFTTAAVSVGLKGAVWDGERMGLDGQWQTHVTRPGIDVRAEWQGMTSFGGDAEGDGDVVFRGCPGTFSLQMARDGQSSPLQAKLKGEFSLARTFGDASRQEITVAKGHLDVYGMTVDGDVKLLLGGHGPEWQGKLAANAPDLSRTLRLFADVTRPVPNSMRSVKLSAQAKGTLDNVQLSGLKATLGGTNLKGDLRASWKKNLSVDFSLDADQYVVEIKEDPPAPPAKKGKGAAAPVVDKGTPWDLRFLKALTAKGELRIGTFEIQKMRFTSVKIPVAMADGNILWGPATGTFYGGSLHFKGEGRIDRGIDMKANIGLGRVDIGSASRARGGSFLLEGRGAFLADIEGNMTGSGSMSAPLNGTWALELADGSYQELKEGVPKGSPIVFDTVRVSGTMKSGVAKADDFVLKGDKMVVKGKGWIDFPKDEQDWSFIVNMKGLPDIPMRIYGQFGDSKTSVNAPAVVINTIGELTMGVFSVLGGVVKGVFGIFTPTAKRTKSGGGGKAGGLGSGGGKNTGGAGSDAGTGGGETGAVPPGGGAGGAPSGGVAGPVPPSGTGNAKTSRK